MTERAAIATVRRYGRGASQSDQDLVAVEAPLALEVAHPSRAAVRSLGILMRTPGDDRALALGLLYAEGIVGSASDVVGVDARAESDEPAAVRVTLAAHVAPPDETTARALIGSSACGLCGRLALSRLEGPMPRDGSSPSQVTPAVVAAIQDRLREGQAVFAETGGLHAAGLFDAAGRLVAMREDVGRHNAVDKLVGALFEARGLPATDQVLAVSGRVAYEIVQKAVRAGVTALVAVGAPSSLAVDAARAAGLTLIGFARDGRFNVYSGFERVADG